MLQLVALGSDPAAAVEVAAEVGAMAYVANDATHPKAPFLAMVRAATDDLALLEPAADVALHLVYARQIKSHDVTWEPTEPTPGVVAAFGLRSHPDLGHAGADRHWREVHAPLAVEHHAAMWDYVQLSVLRTLEGPELDGIALCAFPTQQDHDERFFNNAESERVIGADVATFADLTRSPRPVLLTEILAPVQHRS